MFLKDIKLCGIFDIGDTKHEFVYKNDHAESNENFINNISNIKIIEALMLIFDLKYDSKYNFENIINARHKGESFVEITLHQNSENTYSHYEWLVRNELKLKRVFQTPKVIYINKKRCDISIFHQALINLGFHNINDVCIHRLMDNDILKFGKFIGDDFWSMLTKVFDHQELIEMVERKAGVVRNRAIKRSYGIVVDTVQKELPRKLELRNAIYERVQMNKNFLTLFYIITERRIAIIQAIDELNNAKIRELKPEINRKVLENHQMKVKNTLPKEIFRAKNVLTMVREFYKDAKYVVERHNRECSGKELSGLIEILANAKTPNVNAFLEENYNLKSRVESNISSVKLALLQASKDGTYDETKELLEALCLEDENYLNLINSDEYTATLVDSECIINSDKIPQMEEDYLNNLLDVSKKLSKYYDDIDNKLKQIDEIMVELNISPDEFETLLNIERLIKNSPENISSNYLGPLFKYLNPKSHLGVIMWKEIEETGNKILFKTKDSLNLFIKKFSQEIKKCSAVQFCTIDELQVKELDENSLHGDPSFVTMQDLISDQIESEELKNALFILLHDFILVDGTEYEENEITENYCIKTCDGISSITKYKGIMTIRNEWNNIWEINGTSPVEAFQKYYKLIGEYLMIESTISKALSVKIKAKCELYESKLKTMNEHVHKVSNKTTIVHSKNSNKIAEMTAFNEKMKELLEVSREEYKNWNKKELEDKITSKPAISKFFKFFDDFEIEHFASINEIRFGMAEIFAEFDDCVDRAQDDRFSDVLRLLAEEFQKFEADVINKTEYINELYDTIDDYVENCEENTTMKDIGDLNATNVINQMIIKGLDKSLDFINENPTFYFKQPIYDEFVEQDIETIKNEMSESYKQLITKKKMNRIDLNNIDPAVYQNLIDSLGKVQEFSKKDVFSHLKVKKRAYPLMNVVVIKILKDTVYNFTSTYNSILADYIEPSNLFFYTKSAMNEVDDSNFSWNCFDITRLKSIDFVEKWKNDQRTLPTECRQLIKAFLLILHIINYISVFKFVIISEKIFEDMEVTIAEKLRNFLKNISQFVQIIHYKEQVEEVAEQEEEDSHRPMDISDQDYLSQ